ncbi:MAG: spermine synthase, partial [Chloroflexi bacterium]
DFFLAAPYFTARRPGVVPVERVAIVGLAAGTIARQYTIAFGAVPIDGIELDAEIVAAGRQYFELTQPNVNVIIGDGRWVLAHSSERYSVVLVDAYRLPYIPAHLTTAEFFREVRAHLTRDGALAVNVGRAPDDRRLVDAIATTLASVFASVHIMDVPRSLNSVLVATMEPTQSAMLQRNLEALPASAHPLLRMALAAGVQALQLPAEPGLLFTDDLVPIEQLTDSILFRFLLQSGSARLEG